MKKKSDTDLDEICVELLRRTKPTSRIMVSVPKGRGLVVSVHSEIRRAIKKYVKRRLKQNGK